MKVFRIRHVIIGAGITGLTLASKFEMVRNRDKIGSGDCGIDEWGDLSGDDNEIENSGGGGGGILL